MNDLNEPAEAYVPIEHPLIRRIYENARIPQTDIDARIENLSESILAGVLDREDRIHFAGLAALYGKVHVLNMLERRTIYFCAD